MDLIVDEDCLELITIQKGNQESTYFNYSYGRVLYFSFIIIMVNNNYLIFFFSQLNIILSPCLKSL